MRSVVVLLLLSGVALAEDDYETKRRTTIAAMRDKLEKSPKALSTAFSARLCAEQDKRTVVLEDIAEHRKYEKQTGVVRLGALDSLRTDLELADQQIAMTKQYMAENKIKRLPCKGIVDTLRACLFAGAPADCDTVQVQALLAVAGEGDYAHAEP